MDWISKEVYSRHDIIMLCGSRCIFFFFIIGNNLSDAVVYNPRMHQGLLRGASLLGIFSQQTLDEILHCITLVGPGWKMRVITFYKDEREWLSLLLVNVVCKSNNIKQLKVKRVAKLPRLRNEHTNSHHKTIQKRTFLGWGNQSDLSWWLWKFLDRCVHWKCELSDLIRKWR